MIKLLKRVNWVNTLFILIMPVVGVVGTMLLCIFGIVHWPTWIFAGLFWLISGISVTAGYHRLFSHKAYKSSWLIRLILLLLASSTFEGSALEWSTDHRNHHLYTDTDRDPYSIKKGFWWVAYGLVISIGS